jgi:hypothetical protein
MALPMRRPGNICPAKASQSCRSTPVNRLSGARQSEESPMPYVTDVELVEIVPDLRALAAVEASAEVRAALIRLADRYAAMADHPISALAA